MRGYVATGNPTFLQPYNLTLSRIGADRKAFKAAAAARGVFRPAAGRGPALGMVLAQLARLKLDVSHGASPGSLVTSLKQDKVDMDRLRGQIAAISARAPAAAACVAHRNSTNSLEERDRRDRHRRPGAWADRRPGRDRAVHLGYFPAGGCGRGERRATRPRRAAGSRSPGRGTSSAGWPARLAGPSSFSTAGPLTSPRPATRPSELPRPRTPSCPAPVMSCGRR